MPGNPNTAEPQMPLPPVGPARAVGYDVAMQAADDPKSVATRDLRIVDSQGTRRVWISTEMYGGNPVLVLSDSDGRERVSIHIDEANAASIAILDANGHPVVGLGQSADGRIGIQVSTPNGMPGFVFTIHADGRREMAIVDEAGTPIWRAPS